MPKVKGTSLLQMLQGRRYILILHLFLIFSCLDMGLVYAENSLPQEKNEQIAGLSRVKRDPFELTPALRHYIKAHNPDATPRDFEPTKIKVTGMMIVRDMIMATAEIEQIGGMTLKPGMRVSVSKKDIPAISFTVKEISRAGVILIFEGGDEVLYRYE